MTTRVKTYIAAGAAAFTLAAGTQMLLAATSADKATVDQQDQQPRGRGPGFGGPPPGGPGMRGPGGPMGPMGFGPGFRELDLSEIGRAHV